MSASCEQGITLAGDLHARPAGALAVAAGRFASAVSVTAGGQTADAKSVLGVMGLGATTGQHVTVSAAGPDAQEAVAALITDPRRGHQGRRLTSAWPRVPWRPRKREIARAPWLVRENHFFIPNGPWCVPRRPVSPSLS